MILVKDEDLFQLEYTGLDLSQVQTESDLKVQAEFDLRIKQIRDNSIKPHTKLVSGERYLLVTVKDRKKQIVTFSKYDTLKHEFEFFTPTGVRLTRRCDWGYNWYILTVI